MPAEADLFRLAHHNQTKDTVAVTGRASGGAIIGHGSDMGNPSDPGVLDRVPTRIMIPWLLEDRDIRIQEVLEWIRMFDGGERKTTWSDESTAFVDQHVQSPDELDPIRHRLVTGVWSGSYAYKLELELDRVEQLGAMTPNPFAKAWSTKLSASLRNKFGTLKERRPIAKPPTGPNSRIAMSKDRALLT